MRSARCGIVFPRVCGGEGGCAGGVVPLGAVPALYWCAGVSLGGKVNISSSPTLSLLSAGGWFFVWSFVVLCLSCRVLCCSCCVFVCVTCFSSQMHNSRHSRGVARLTNLETRF